ALQIDDLKILLEIEQAGSINKAAKNLFLSHSSLMYMLQRIEKELGYKIFERSKKGTIPTMKGRVVLNDTKEILDIVSNWYDKSPINSLEDSITIMIVPVAAQILGQELLVRLREYYPKLKVSFDEQRIDYTNINSMITVLNTSNARIYIGSIAATEKPAFESLMTSQKDWDYYVDDIDEMVLFAGRDLSQTISNHLLRIEDLRKLPLLYYPDSNLQKFGYTDILDLFPEKQKYKMSTSSFMMELVAKGMAVLLGSWLVTKEASLVKNGSVEAYRIKDTPLTLSYYMLFPSTKNITETERIVVEVIRRCFGVLKKSISTSQIN
ncbi:MAG: LysR family transcriptional regulator, partial [Peptococcaceae bacterium]|nr:LysR family transcriptional regulator [Peptococcaceae bacterium]